MKKLDLKTLSLFWVLGVSTLVHSGQKVKTTLSSQKIAQKTGASVKKIRTWGETLWETVDAWRPSPEQIELICVSSMGALCGSSLAMSLGADPQEMGTIQKYALYPIRLSLGLGLVASMSLACLPLVGVAQENPKCFSKTSYWHLPMLGCMSLFQDIAQNTIPLGPKNRRLWGLTGFMPTIALLGALGSHVAREIGGGFLSPDALTRLNSFSGMSLSILMLNYIANAIWPKEDLHKRYNATPLASRTPEMELTHTMFDYKEKLYGVTAASDSLSPSKASTRSAKQKLVES